MTNRVAQACAAVPGATEDVASRTLSGCEEWQRLQPVGAAWPTEPEDDEKTCRAVRRHIRKTQFAGIGLWGWIQIMGIVLNLIRFWRDLRRNNAASVNGTQPRAAGDDGKENAGGNSEPR